MQKTDGREKQEHKKEDKTTEEKTDDDEGKRGKDPDHEICVITWNVNISSAQYDFLSDVAQCQANVAMFQGTPNWQPDGTAEELGCTLLKEQKQGKAVIAVKRQNMGLLRLSCTSNRWSWSFWEVFSPSRCTFHTRGAGSRTWKSTTRC